jgi:predicted negative regulator of RcsB-dependent stress response
MFVGAMVAALVCVLGFVAWRQIHEASAIENSVKVFEFQSKTWEDAKAGKMTPKELTDKYAALPSEVHAAPVMIPVALEIAKFLYEKGSYAEADAILSKVDVSKNDLGKFFVGMQRYVILEKLGKIDEAITTLEDVVKLEDNFMKPVASVELGRLYLAKGEKGKAQSQFDYVVSTFPNDEHAKLAKLYLAQMSK